MVLAEKNIINARQDIVVHRLVGRPRMLKCNIKRLARKSLVTSMRLYTIHRNCRGGNISLRRRSNLGTWNLRCLIHNPLWRDSTYAALSSFWGNKSSQGLSRARRPTTTIEPYLASALGSWNNPYPQKAMRTLPSSQRKSFCRCTPSFNRYS